MTPDQIQSAARRKYNAVGDTFYNDSFFYDLIFQAETELVTEGLLIENTYSTTSVASQREYAYPTSAIAIRRLEYDGNKLAKSTFREDDAMTLSQSDTTDGGTPTVYQTWDRIIYLRPIPDTADLTIKIFTYDEPVLLSTGNANLAVPTVYHTAIVDFVVSHLASKNQDFQTATFYMNRWEQGKVLAKRLHAKVKRTDKFTRVKNVDDLPATHLGVT